jgi:hypothetical protein
MGQRCKARRGEKGEERDRRKANRACRAYVTNDAAAEGLISVCLCKVSGGSRNVS